MTKSNHPVSIYSRIHSSSEKNFISVSDITFNAMERGKALFGKATFVMDRGYDDNKMFLKLDELNSGILSYAKEGVRLWFRTKCPAYRQICFKLIA
jgi:hypothetical protein